MSSFTFFTSYFKILWLLFVYIAMDKIIIIFMISVLFFIFFLLCFGHNFKLKLMKYSFLTNKTKFFRHPHAIITGFSTIILIVFFFLLPTDLKGQQRQQVEISPILIRCWLAAGVIIITLGSLPFIQKEFHQNLFMHY